MVETAPLETGYPEQSGSGVRIPPPPCENFETKIFSKHIELKKIIL